MPDKKPTKSEASDELILYRLDEIKSEIKDIKLHYVTKTESIALKTEITNLREDLNELKKTTIDEIERLKGRNQIKNTVLWAGLVASAIINIIAVYNLFVER
jgi:hypothetical protein